MKGFLGGMLLAPMVALAALTTVVQPGPFTLTNLVTGETSLQPDLPSCVAAAASAASATGPGAVCTQTSTVSFTQSSGPMYDPTKVPPDAVGFAGIQIETTWHNTAWRNDATGLPNPSCTGWGNGCDGDYLDPTCSAAVKTCYTPASDTPAGPTDVGAFRVDCGFARMLKDDPVIFPGQPGASHLHTFFGNVGVNALSTQTSLMTTGNSTCDGGIADRSAYWVPTMIDTSTGAPITPGANNVYYKGSYDFDDSGVVQVIPAGLRMIEGSPHNTDPTQVGARYECVGPNGELPGWQTTITAAATSLNGGCPKGSDFIMSVNFPYCWDGKNLDSPDHTSHVAWTVQDQSAPFAKHCPADHPVVLPQVSYNVHYAVATDNAPTSWRLSSDMYDSSLPAGLSGHGDFFMAWDAATMALFVKNCDAAKMDCHDDLLGNGTKLYGAQ